MRVFLCEFLTSGGLRGQPLPADAVAEALLLRDALAADLEAVPGVTVVLAFDDRLATPVGLSTPVAEGADPWTIWRDLAREAHLVWPVSQDPARLPALLDGLRAAAAHVIGGSAEALAVATTPERLAQALAGGRIPRATPGAGGTPASLSVLARPDGVTLLAVNIRHLSDDGRLLGFTVGARPDAEGTLQALAAAVVKAVPGLSGIFDIDVMLRPEGAAVTTVQPGPTLSYAGLHRARGINPAAFLPELIREGCPPRVPHLPPPVAVEVRLRG
ncbi:ATP-grasp domain-containing protein [Azorhizobium doebereinerae]|uniref:ATP-grasp domain-containing protein n=1 Tax=Azorhizobium doebereinerae TaxID=281091 RepID=UPI00042429AB|nr:ATP-grasp domain-containing protein [Azorhizobium doebereinerae]